VCVQIENALDQEVIAARQAVHELADRQREVATLSRAAAKDLADTERGHRVLHLVGGPATTSTGTRSTP